MTWTDITSGGSSFRYMPEGGTFDMAGPTAFFNSKEQLWNALGIFNSKFVDVALPILNPTLHAQLRDIRAIPQPSKYFDVQQEVKEAIRLSKDDWDSLEVSIDFQQPSILKNNSNSLKETFNENVKHALSMTLQLKHYEEEINKKVLASFGLLGEIDTEVELSRISLSCNPEFYCQSTKCSQGDFYQCNQMISLASYFIGNIMGRFSLDREGLVYSHSGNDGFKELVIDGAYKTFPADDDGIVPLADEDWVFEDDATTRFREFVKTVWGEEHLQENLDFVAESLCLDAIKAKKGESSIDTIRRYFSTQFYKDHLKTYKKRPIYWLFSSGKAKAFECLVYLHRYNEGTLSRMRTEYVTPLMGKLESRKNILEDSKATASGAELRAIDKELKTIEKKQAELVTFDEELKHLAEMKISLDLDDGVKVNYGKFGNLLADVKAIHGKNPEVIK
ncbi:TPA: hypothetical protein NGU34_002443 [Vibrio parahaemolyticus]|nr:hypothetical protein [Vibrio parahaemolyticus]